MLGCGQNLHITSRKKRIQQCGSTGADEKQKSEFLFNFIKEILSYLFFIRKVFDLVRAKDPRLLDKLYFVTGDINEDHLGLNETDAELLIRSVNIVIHSAATVRFNAPVKEALNTNVLGTKRVLDLCVKFDKLKVVLYQIQNPKYL